MTAKHRKSKNNHKHEENFFKNDVVEPEVRTGANSSSVHLVLFIIIVLGGAVGLWFCFQQHQTLTHLTDSVAGMQMKMMKLQSAHEELRQSGTKHLSQSLDTRLNALEESHSLAQKQLGVALATVEQLRSSDLPAQVLSLHTEMTSRLADVQQASVSLEQLSQLQSAVKGKSEELQGVRGQVDGLVALGSQLSQKVEVLTGRLREAESKLEEGSGRVTTLSSTLEVQGALVHSLKEQVESRQGQLEARTPDITAVRELLQMEEFKWLQEANMEEQLSTLRRGLQDQISAAHNLTSGLQAQLEDVQKQVTQLVEKAPADPQDQTPPAEPEAPPAEPEAPPAEPQDQTPPAEPELALPGEEDASAGTEEEQQAPPAEMEEEAPANDEAQQEVSMTGDDASTEDTPEDKEDGDSIETEGGESLEEEVPEEPEVQQESMLEQEDEMLREEEPEDVNQVEEETPAAGEEVLVRDEGLTEESHGEMESHEEVEAVVEQPAPEENHEEEEEEESNGNDEEQDFPAEWESHSREETDEAQEFE